MKLTKWERVRDFFSCMQNSYIERQQFLLFFKGKIDVERLDEYRCILMKAGYLRPSLFKGYYRKVKDIPINLTYSQARKLAYGK